MLRHTPAAGQSRPPHSVLDKEPRDFGWCFFYPGIAHAVALDDRCFGLRFNDIGSRRVDAAAAEGGKGYNRLASQRVVGEGKSPLAMQMSRPKWESREKSYRIGRA